MTSKTAVASALALALGCSTPAISRYADDTHGNALDAWRDPDAGALSDVGAMDAGSLPDTGSIADSSLADAATQDAFAVVTTIRIVYPAGHTITLRGSGAPLSWTSGIAVPETGGGVYEVALHGLAAAIEFKPLLDDATWSRGPNFHVAPGQRIEIAPHFVATSGRVETLLPAWSSTLLGNTRVVYAYLPAAYDENTAAHFTVLTMHDGQNLFDAALAFGHVEWQVDETMDAAGEGGLCADGATACASDGECASGICDTFDATIVIGVANTASRIDEYTPTVDPTRGGGRGDLYLRALVEELRPMVDASLRTRTGRADTAMMGSSLGGLISAHAGVVRSDTFGLIGAMSPSTWWDGTELIGEIGTIPAHATRALRVYVDSGDSGDSMDGVTDTASLAAAYRAVGYVEGADFRYVVQPGGEHSEAYWAERLPAALAFLLPRRERALP